MPINPGMIIIQEMRRFLSKVNGNSEKAASVKTTFPYLQIISCLLKMEGIWPTKYDPRPVTKFNVTNLRKMKLKNFKDDGSKEAKTPKKKSEKPASKKRKISSPAVE